VLGPNALVVTPYSAQHIGLFLLGWAAGMANALRTNTLVLYSQVYVPVLVGTSLRTFFTGASISPLTGYGSSALFALSALPFVAIASKVPEAVHDRKPKMILL